MNNEAQDQHIPPYGKLDNETVTKLVSASLASLPPQFRTTDLARLLAQTLKDHRTQRMLRGSPRKLLALAGIDIPESVKINVHETTHHSLHLLLPHPMTLGGTDYVSDSADAGDSDQVVLSDEDLTTGESNGGTSSDIWNTGDWFADPITPDDKSDTRVGGMIQDLTNYFGSDNDADVATPADTGD